MKKRHEIKGVKAERTAMFGISRTQTHHTATPSGNLLKRTFFPEVFGG